MENHVSSIRTQIYLPYDLHQEVVERAKKNGISFAAQVRQDLKRPKKTIAKKNYFLAAKGIIKDESATDISANSAKYLKQMYEEKIP
jgi:hypothetical protein